MKGNNRHARRNSIVFVIMGFLAVCSIGLTWATVKNYIGASTAAAKFRCAVLDVTCKQEDSKYAILIDLSLENRSEWNLSVTTVRPTVYIDGEYVWGRNYDWLGNPLELPRGSQRDLVLEIEVPDTKTEIVTRGKEAWSIRVSGLLDMPRLGTKLFVTKAVIPLERGNE
jgi:hypothetical protein